MSANPDSGVAGLGNVAIRRFPTLTVQTPRLDVRPLAAADAEAVAEIFADKQTQRWLPFPQEFGQIDGLSWCTEMAAERRDSGHGRPLRRSCGARTTGSSAACGPSAPTGSAGSPRSSYAVAADARGFGVAAEAVDALAMALILEHGFQRIELRVAPGNIASRRVAEKAGFSYEGLLRNAGYVHSGRVDLEVWSIVAADLR